MLVATNIAVFRVKGVGRDTGARVYSTTHTEESDHKPPDSHHTWATRIQAIGKESSDLYQPFMILEKVCVRRAREGQSYVVIGVMTLYMYANSGG